MAAVRRCGAAALALALALGAARAQECDGGSSLDTLTGIPRRNLAFSKVSAELGQYEPLLQPCEADNICLADSFDQFGELDFLEVIRDKNYATDHPESYINYLSSLAMYAGVGIFFAVVAVIVGITACCCRICGCCGRPPILEEYEDTGELVKPQEYPIWQTVAAYACVSIFTLLMVIFMMLGIFSGSYGFTDAQLALVDAPDNLVVLAQGVADPLVALLASVVGETGVSLVERLNATLVEGADLVTLHASFICAADLLSFLQNNTIAEEIVAGLSQFRDALTGAATELDLSDATAQLTAQINAINASLNSADAVLDDFAIVLQNPELAGLDTEIANLNTLVASTRADVTAVRAQLAAYLALTTSAESVSTTITPLVGANPLNPYTPETIEAFLTAYQSFTTQLAAAPTESQVSDALVALNATLDQVDGQLATINNNLLGIQTELDAAPTTAEINATLNAILTSIDDFDLSGVKTELDGIAAYLGGLPSIDIVLNATNQLFALKDEKMPCILESRDIPAQVNDNLVELPADFQDIEQIFDTVDYAVGNATLQLTTAQAEIRNIANAFNATVHDVIAALGSEFDSATALLSTAKEGIIQLQAELTIADLASVNLTGPIADIVSLREQLANPALHLTDDTLTSFSASATLRSDVSTALTNLDGTGFIGRVEAIANSSATDLDCENEALTCYDVEGATATFTACSVEFDCPYPFQEWTSLKTAVDAYAASVRSISPDLETELLPQLDASLVQLDGIDLACCTSLPDFSAIADSVALASGQLDAAQATLVLVLEGLAVVDGELADALASSNELDTAFDSISEQVLSFNSSAILSTFNSTQLQEVVDTEAKLYDMLFVDLEQVLAELRKPRLLEIAAGADGIEAMMLHIARQADLIVANVDPAAANLEQSVSEMVSQLRLIDTLRDNDNALRKHGSIYYLDFVIASATDSDSVGADASEFNIYEKPAFDGYIDGAGNRIPYPTGIKCLTDECLRNMIDYVNGEDLDSIAPELGVVMPPFSRSIVMSVPFIIPAIIIVMALLVFCAPICGYGLACCATCVMPFIFVIVGAFVFPFLIFAADACAGAESVVAVTLDNVEGQLCLELNGTFVGPGNCQYDFDIASLSKQVQLDTPEIFRSMFQECAGRSTANLPPGTEPAEPITMLFKSIGDDASGIVSNELNKILNNDLPDFGLVLRPALRSDFDLTVDDLAGNVVALSSDLNSAIGCGKLSNAYLGLKEPICCEFGDALYWSIAAWYLMAFTMLFCGVPGGCFAATRLQNVRRAREHLRVFYQETGRVVGDRIIQARAVVAQSGGGRQGSDEMLASAPAAMAVPVDENGNDIKPARKGIFGSRFSKFATSMKLGRMARRGVKYEVADEEELSSFSMVDPSDRPSSRR